MKRFLSWLIKPWVLSCIGLALVSLIIWFEAPLLAFDGKVPFESENVRWWCILTAWMGWAAYFIWKMVAARMAATQLIKGVVGDAQTHTVRPEEPESAAELAVLNKRFQQAIAVLRKAKLGSNAGGLYQLPWYMFVGAPGTGKTTALVQSGLHFPLSDTLGKSPIGGVGGTRNCDWWFADEAVLLDTAGRYTTQDSDDAVDKAAWHGFLGLLVKYRKRRPINGVIVALSAADLLRQNESERRTQALAIRERIKELHERLGIRFPVYVMVTKCDLLAGFIEYFDGLGRDEREQVWGMTFPLVPADQIDQTLALFPAEFQMLERQLQMRVLDRMQQERDRQRRALIYHFPQQFAQIGEELAHFLRDVFASTRYEECALLRGVYFTSGTQEGSPIDRVLGSLAAAFGLDRKVLPANVASGRSYFITRLLRQVIFQEAGVAGVNLRLERHRLRLQWGAMAALGLVGLLLGVGLVTSYVNNQQYIKAVSLQVAQIKNLTNGLSSRDQVAPMLPVLHAVRDISGGYADRDGGRPFLMGLGLYQGDKLGEAATRAYHRFLKQSVLPYIASRMEEQLRRGSANSTDYLYEVLRVYLMLGDRTHFDAEAVQAWVDFDLSRHFSEATGVERQALSNHVAALLRQVDETDAPLQLDATLIAQTRLTLAKMPLGERAYHRLKRDLAHAKLAEFDVSSAGGREAAQVLMRQSGQPLTRGIAGMYTVAGVRKFLQQIDQSMADVVKDSWVLDKQEATNSRASIESMKATLQQLYYDDYIKQWDTLLADVVVVPLSSLDQAARIVNILSGAESPLRKFLQEAAKQTTLGGVTSSTLPGAVTNVVKGKLDAAKKKLESTFAADADPAPAPKSLHPVDAHFEALHKMMAGSGSPNSSQFDQVLQKLKEVAVFFDAANSAKAAGTPAPAGEALVKLKREADGAPAPLAALLKNIDSSGVNLTLGSERMRLNALWTASAAPFCKKAISGRYPLVRSAKEEVTPDDFGNFFGPLGLMDDFFQKNLQAYVDMSASQWRWRTVNQVSLGLSQEVLNEFQRAAAIRDKFFYGGGKQASMRFDLKPQNMDASLAKLSLELDGQTLTWAQNVPARATSFQLPSGKGGNLAHLEVSPANGHGELKAEGPWAWFRMIDKGILESGAQSERFKLSFDLEGRKVIFDLTANSVNNPFKRDVLEKFRCPERL